MKLTTTNKQIVEDVNYGTYIWQVGKEFVANEEGDPLCIFAIKGDQEKIKQLKDAVKYWAGEDVLAQGHPRFIVGARPVDDEEYERQLARQAAGLVPDPLDVGALADEARGIKENGR